MEDECNRHKGETQTRKMQVIHRRRAIIMGLSCNLPFSYPQATDPRTSRQGPKQVPRSRHHDVVFVRSAFVAISPVPLMHLNGGVCACVCVYKQLLSSEKGRGGPRAHSQRGMMGWRGFALSLPQMRQETFLCQSHPASQPAFEAPPLAHNHSKERDLSPLFTPVTIETMSRHPRSILLG